MNLYLFLMINPASMISTENKHIIRNIFSLERPPFVKRPFENAPTMFTINIEISYCLTVHVLKFEQLHFITCLFV